MTTTINEDINQQNIINTNVTFENIDDYYAYVRTELIKKDYFDIMFFSRNFGNNYSFANICNPKDLDRYYSLNYQLIDNTFFKNLLGIHFNNDNYHEILKARKSHDQLPQKFSHIPLHIQEKFLKRAESDFYNVKEITQINDYNYLHKSVFYITTSLFHNDIHFVKAFTKQISFNGKNSSKHLLGVFEILHSLVDFNKGSLLFDTILNSVLAKQLTISDTNTLNEKSEQMFKFISTLKEDIQDTFYANLFKKLSAKEQFLGKGIINNSLFPEKLYDKYMLIFKDISTQSAIETLDDPSVLKSNLSVKENVSISSNCYIPLIDLQNFYKKLYTKKTFPIDHNIAITLDHVFDSMNIDFTLHLDASRTNVDMNFSIAAPYSKIEQMREIQQYFNDNIISFIDKCLLYSHKILIESNDKLFFTPNHYLKSNNKNIKDLFVIFINEYRENILRETLSKEDKEHSLPLHKQKI